MHLLSILGIAAVALANPLPRPVATAEAYAAPAAEAAPVPTAMPEPQFGGSLNTPFGTFSVGSSGIGYQPPGAGNNGIVNRFGGRQPPQQSCNGFIAGCIYSSVSKDIQGEIYTAISDGIFGGFRGSGNRNQPQPTVTIIYTPTPQPWYNNNGGNYNGGRGNGWRD